MKNKNDDFVTITVPYDWNGNMVLGVPRLIMVDPSTADKMIKDGIHLASTETHGVKIFKRGNKRFHSKKNGGPGSSFSEYVTGTARARRRADAKVGDYRLSAYQ